MSTDIKIIAIVGEYKRPTSGPAARWFIERDNLLYRLNKLHITPTTVCVTGEGVSNMVEVIAYSLKWEILKFIPDFKRYDIPMAVRKRNLQICDIIDALFVYGNPDKSQGMISPAELRDIPIFFMDESCNRSS